MTISARETIQAIGGLGSAEKDNLYNLLASLAGRPGVIQIPLTSLVNEAGTQLTTFSDGASATPGFSQESNKEMVVRWNNHAAPTAVAVSGLTLPPDLDASSDLTVHWRILMSGTTDTPALLHEVYLGAADTDCAGTDPEIDGAAALTEYSATVANADIGGSPEEMTLNFKPTGGELGTDDLLLYSVWIEYTRSQDLIKVT